MPQLERNTSDVSFLTIPKVQQYQIKKEEYSERVAMFMADPTMIVTRTVLCLFFIGSSFAISSKKGCTRHYLYQGSVLDFHGPFANSFLQICRLPSDCIVSLCFMR